jgi:DNA-binding MarR family transcriptional regulator
VEILPTSALDHTKFQRKPAMTKAKLIEQIAGDFAELKRAAFGYLVGRVAPGVSGSQGELFMFLAHEGPVSVKAIASHMHISSGGVTQLVDPLEALGLVERKTDPNDRRITLVSLSATGKKRLQGVKEQYLERFNSLFKGLDTHELETLHKTLQKITVKINEDKEV